MSLTGDELRPVTALFADIVGSTALGERLTPGEVKALVGECVSRMSRAAEEFGGTIQAYTGDGICAYFGLPVAHEDDPERAARAALRILEVAQEYARDVEGAWGIPDFNVRVGINSGQTGVGLVGGAVPQSVALGDTTNVAARLQSAAAPGTIAVGAETARRLAHNFVLESLGEIQVKGRTEAVAAWRLTGLGTGPEAKLPVPLVGREEEMARLGRIVDELAAGRGQILLVAGEAGIGKTRLLSELRTLAAGRSLTWLEGSSVSYGRELLSGPFVDILRGWLNVEEGDAEVAVRMRLRAKLGALMGERATEVLPSLGRLMSVHVDQDLRTAAEALPPEAQAVDAQRAYRAWIESLAAAGPMVVAIDDLHWADPSTRMLAEQLLDVTDGAPLLLVAAFRADSGSEAWPFRMRVIGDYAHRAEELALKPLSEAAARQLADLLLPPGSIDDVTKEGLISRAEGNPLYLEELLRSVLETGSGQRGRTWTVSVRHLLPSSLESLFVARIDRLPAGARRLVQVAAVIGRDFPVRVLERLAETEEVTDDLGTLLRADLVRELRRYPELECRFRHGLIQEAALSGLTADRLRELHGRVGVAFEEVYAGSLEEYLEVLAYHFYRSDDPAKALHYLERAAEKAAALGAIGQAAEMLRRARKAAGKVGDEAAGERLARRLAEVDST
jgi:class 3 adenylate cyclase/predicted ATPase